MLDEPVVDIRDFLHQCETLADDLFCPQRGESSEQLHRANIQTEAKKGRNECERELGMGRQRKCTHLSDLSRSSLIARIWATVHKTTR